MKMEGNGTQCYSPVNVLGRLGDGRKRAEVQTNKKGTVSFRLQAQDRRLGFGLSTKHSFKAETGSQDSGTAWPVVQLRGPRKGHASVSSLLCHQYSELFEVIALFMQTTRCAHGAVIPLAKRLTINSL